MELTTPLKTPRSGGEQTWTLGKVIDDRHRDRSDTYYYLYSTYKGLVSNPRGGKMCYNYKV